MRYLFRPSKIVGLDLGSNEIKAVEVSTGFKGIEITGVARISTTFSQETEDPGSLVRAIQGIAATDLFPAEWLISGLQGDQVAVRRFDLPQFQAQKGEALVKYEMESLLPYQEEDIVVDYLSRSSKNGKTNVLAMAVLKDTISRYMERLNDARIEPKMLGWSTLASYAALAASSGWPQQGTSCLLDVGTLNTSMVIFDPEGPLLIRSLDLGGADLTAGLAGELNITPKEAEAVKKEQGLGPQSSRQVKEALTRVLYELIQEMEVSLLSLKTSLDHIFITGGTSNMPGLDLLFRNRFGVECRQFNGFQYFSHDLPEHEASRGSEYTAALGLALSALAPDSRTVDFRKEEFAFRRPLSLIRGKLIMSGIMVFAILALLVANLVLALNHKETRYKALKTEIRDVFTQTFPQVKTIVNEESQMGQAIDKAKKGLASVALGRSNGSLLDLFNQISREIPLKSQIRVTELELGDREIMLLGEAKSFESVDQLKERLSALPGLGKAKVEGANANEFSKVIEFSIKVIRER